jgi:hypothetical protein
MDLPRVAGRRDGLQMRRVFANMNKQSRTISKEGPLLERKYIQRLKIKVNLSLCLSNEALSHEYTWVSGGASPSFFTSALDGCEWLASSLVALHPGKVPTVPIG